jgi:hypothetical protein
MRRWDLVVNLLVATVTPLPRLVTAQAQQVRIPARIAVFFSGSPQTAFEAHMGAQFCRRAARVRLGGGREPCARVVVFRG